MEQGGGVLQVVSQYDSGTLHGGFARYVRAASITVFAEGVSISVRLTSRLATVDSNIEVWLDRRSIGQVDDHQKNDQQHERPPWPGRIPPHSPQMRPEGARTAPDGGRLSCRRRLIGHVEDHVVGDVALKVITPQTRPAQERSNV